MKKCLTKWLVTTTAAAMMLMNTAAYAHPDPIMTDTFPICIYTGDVPDSFFQSNPEYDEWYQYYIDTYHGFYSVYTYPNDRDYHGGFPISVDDMSEKEFITYIRENYEALIEDGYLKVGGTMSTAVAPRRSVGEIKDVEYETITREYLIPLKDGKTAVLDTPDGYVFLGGEYDPAEVEHDGDPGILDAVASEQSGWKAEFYMGNVCSVQRFCGNKKVGYYHINEVYSWGDLVDKQKKVENLLILPLEDCRGMMASATQNWALEQAIQQSQAEGFEEDWQEWVEWNKKYGN